ncbi:LysR family transcriptional regulator substrate-binding protein [Bordetella trematum]|uniref:LysR family transcriptional regulator substrate-binding protein n=1 Tax=Bordetella trematum TaxID=123899 RepID=UPI003D0D0F2D
MLGKEVRDSIAGEALALLRERRVDVAITARGDPRPADLLYEELFSEPFVLFHSAAIAAPLRHWDTAKLGRLPLISMLPGTSVRELTESVFQKEAQRFEPMYSLRDLGAIARFVQANCGIALLPESAVDYSALRGVRKTRLKNAPTRSIGLFIRQGEPCGRLLQTTLQALRELGRARQHEP